MRGWRIPWVAVVAFVLTACNSSAARPNSPSSASSPAAGSPSNGCPQDGAYSGQDQSPISFTISNCKIHDLHGTTLLYCDNGSPSTQTTYSDGNDIPVAADGTFSDDYKYPVGNGTWTLHVEGTVNDDGTATGFSSVLGVGCSAGALGWAAARPGVALPPKPTSPPTSAAAACSPEPCQTQGGVTLSVQSATKVTETDNSAPGVVVAFTVVNNSSTSMLISNTFSNFTLHLGDGTAVDHSYAAFQDSSGQDVSCLRGDPVNVDPGQQASEKICFALPSDETGQSLTFSWTPISPGNFSVPIGTLQ